MLGEGQLSLYTNMLFLCFRRICKLKVSTDRTQYCDKGYKITYDSIQILFQGYWNLEKKKKTRLILAGEKI